MDQNPVIVSNTRVVLKIFRNNDETGHSKSLDDAAWTVEGTRLVRKRNTAGSGPAPGVVPKTPAAGRSSMVESLMNARTTDSDLHTRMPASCPYTPLVAVPSDSAADRWTPSASGRAESGAGGRPTSFTFDSIILSDACQTEVYDEMSDLVETALSGQGVRSTVFSYGQPGTGKTLAMLGNLSPATTALGSHSSTSTDSVELAPELGLVPRAIYHSLAAARRRPEEQLSLHLAVVDYGVDGFRNLLNARCSPIDVDSMDKKMTIDRGNTDSWLRSVAVPIESWAAALARLASSVSNSDRRNDDGDDADADHTGDDISLHSKRPPRHTIYCLFIELTGGDSDARRRDQLMFVDLAGSRPVSTVSSERAARHIRCANSSVSAIGNVLAALSSHRYSGPVPVDADPLARALAPSLSSGRVAFLVTASLSTVDYSPTLLSCTFGCRARRLRTVASAAQCAVPEAAADDLAMTAALLEASVREMSRLEELLLSERRQNRKALINRDRQWRARSADLAWQDRQRVAQLNNMAIALANAEHTAAVHQLRSAGLRSDAVQAQLDLFLVQDSELAATDSETSPSYTLCRDCQLPVDPSTSSPCEKIIAIDDSTIVPDCSSVAMSGTTTQLDQNDDEPQESLAAAAEPSVDLVPRTQLIEVTDELKNLKAQQKQLRVRVKKEKAKTTELRSELAKLQSQLAKKPVAPVVKLSKADGNRVAELEVENVVLKKQIKSKADRIDRLNEALALARQTINDHLAADTEATDNEVADNELPDSEVADEEQVSADNVCVETVTDQQQQHGEVTCSSNESGSLVDDKVAMSENQGNDRGSVDHVVEGSDHAPVESRTDVDMDVEEEPTFDDQSVDAKAHDSLADQENTSNRASNGPVSGQFLISPPKLKVSGRRGRQGPRTGGKRSSKKRGAPAKAPTLDHVLQTGAYAIPSVVSVDVE